MGADWSAARPLFDAAMQQPAAPREASVRSAEAGDAVEAEVRSLLAHADETDADFLSPAAPDASRHEGRLCSS